MSTETISKKKKKYEKNMAIPTHDKIWSGLTITDLVMLVTALDSNENIVSEKTAAVCMKAQTKV